MFLESVFLKRHILTSPSVHTSEQTYRHILCTSRKLTTRLLERFFQTGCILSVLVLFSLLSIQRFGWKDIKCLLLTVMLQHLTKVFGDHPNPRNYGTAGQFKKAEMIKMHLKIT